MVTTRLDRMVRYVRRWRMVSDGIEALAVDPDLPDFDLRRLRRLIEDCIDARGGEVTARATARSIGATFSSLSTNGRRRFFDLLAEEYGDDDIEVDLAIDAVIRAGTPEDRRQAQSELRAALEPRRERLLRRFAGLDGGLPFLISLREDLRMHLATQPGFRPVDADLKRILDGWFDVALLRLERLTWDSSATLLERLIDYEAVHAIESWDDLKGRLGPGRRCYAFLHPSMPDDPLIFVEVALTEGIATSLPSVLDHEASRVDAHRADAAIFYSISNCHDGLAGVRLGDFLIKSVAEVLSEELPNLKEFATLSPLPGFRRWLLRALDDDQVTLTADEEELLVAPGHHDSATAVLAELVGGTVPDGDDAGLAAAEPVLLRLAADYLLNRRRGARTVDPVAHFHLSNGAMVERINWWANPSAAGWERGLGMMVNYRYRLKNIERNHDGYVGRGEIATADAVRKLLG